MRIVWTREALDKLIEIEEFIAHDSSQRAEAFVNYLIERAESISQNLQIGWIVPEISNPEIREIIVPKYRIVFQFKRNPSKF